MKHRILYWLLLVCLPVFGENDFTYLDWNELHIDSILPTYTEVVPLASDYRMNDYTVALEYPEYGALTAEEEAVVEQFKENISDKLQIDTHVGVQRGKGMLDISFIPIIRQNSKYQKLLSCRITILPHRKANIRKTESTRKQRYASHSVLQQGKWVKISIKQDGMYSLTRSSLKKMGFTNPNNVHLYGYGGHRQNEVINADTDYDDLEEVPLYQQNSDTWLFWGNGLLYWDGNTRIQNHYANAAYYFLTEESAPNGIKTEESAKGNVRNVYSTFTDHVLYEKDEYAWFSGGRDLYESANYANSSHSYKLSTPHSVGDETLTIAFSAASETKTTLQPVVNGTPLSPAMTLPELGKYVYATTETKTYDIGNAKSSDSWNIKLSSTSGNDARLDYLALHYTRQIVPTDGYVAFSHSGTGLSQFDIKASSPVVMRISEPGLPAVIINGKQSGDNYSIVVDDPTRRYVAFLKSASFPEPTFVGHIQNQDLHSLDSVDMVIIVPTSGKLIQQAQRLSDAHKQYDHLYSVIVKADEVYNEFSSGTPDATAYRRLMKMLYDKAEGGQHAPRYLLLMGDAAWDNRMLTQAWKATSSPDDYLLCYESENSVSDVKCYVMEDYFGLLDDGEGADLLKDKTDLGIGRFPVVAASEAKVMVDKCIRHMSRENAGAWQNIVSFLGDDGDENDHMKYADDVANRVQEQCPEMDIRKIMWDAYSRVSTAKNNTYPEVTALLKEQMKDGVLVVNYTGHASTYTLSHEFVLNVEDFANTKSTNLPLWMTAACDVMPFDGQSANIGETAVLNPNGGALAFFGTTRTVYANLNAILNRYFMQYLFGQDDNGNTCRVGDAIRLTKNSLIGSSYEYSLGENKLHYALLGDPALTIAPPKQRITLDSINGISTQQETSIPLTAGSRITLSGHISNAQGDALSNFQGTLTVRLYDEEKTIQCHNNAGSKNTFSFKDRTDVLYQAQDSVRGGLFTHSFTIPKDISGNGSTGRLVFYAISNDKDTDANGYSESFTLNAMSEESVSDSIGPTIYAYLNNEEFQDGDVVNSMPYFIAQLEDENGMNVSGNGLGHDLTLCVDGRADYTFNLNNYYTGLFGDNTKGTVAFSIPQLEAGSHTLEFQAWDVLNNCNKTTLSFVVNPALKPDLEQLSATPNPAINQTTFLIAYDRPGAECTFTLEVFDFMGRCLWSHTETGSSDTGLYRIPWNLCTGEGGRLGSGIYLYRCTLQSGASKKVTKTQKIIVLNNK